MRSPSRYWIAVAAVYLAFSVLITQYHARHKSFVPGLHQRRAVRHEQVLSGQGDSPWTYRILAPALAEASRPVLAPLTGEWLALEYAYIFWRWVFTFALLLLFHRYLAFWLDPAWSFAGTLFVAGLHIPSFEHSWFNLNLTIDFALWTAGAILTLRGRNGWLFPLIAIGALNRSASVFLIPIHAALGLSREPFRKVALRSAALGLCWAGPTFALRAAIGVKPWAQPVPQIIEQNLDHPEWWLWAGAFLGAFWVLPFLRFRAMPRELQRLTLFLAPYLPLQLVFGRIIEARLFLPLTIVLVPMGLLFLREAAAEGLSRRRAGSPPPSFEGARPDPACASGDSSSQPESL